METRYTNFLLCQKGLIFLIFFMLDLFKLLIQQLNSSVFVLLGILVLAFMLTAKVSAWINNFKHDKERLDKFEKK